MDVFAKRAGIATQLQVGILKVITHTKQLCFTMANLIAWQSQRQSLVALSRAEAELTAAV